MKAIADTQKKKRKSHEEITCMLLHVVEMTRAPVLFICLFVLVKKLVGHLRF